ncbi:MAG: metallophosphoesterase family protein [Acidobacteriota bacterium]|nr:serine/threonine protein phosphatase [Blastocatellia bacterium]MDW8412119.1 metallophosphoesterase family protein [Acidobacteriota bacterium]
MKTFAVGDVHGQFRALKRLLAKLPIDYDKDLLVFVGDLVDRGPQSDRVLDYVRNLQRAIVLQGNHEQMMLKAYENELAFDVWISMGGNTTYRNYCGNNLPDWKLYRRLVPKDVLAYLASLPWIYRNEHALFVHAGARRTATGAWSVEDRYTALWYRDLDFWREYDAENIVVGHTPTNKIRKMLGQPLQPDKQMQAWSRGPILAIDCGAGLGYRLCAVQLPERVFYYEEIGPK